MQLAARRRSRRAASTATTTAPTLTLVDDCSDAPLGAARRRSGDAKLAVVPLLHEIVDALRNLVYPKIMGTLRGAGAAAAPTAMDRRVQRDRPRRRLRVAAARPVGAAFCGGLKFGANGPRARGIRQHLDPPPPAGRRARGGARGDAAPDGVAPPRVWPRRVRIGSEAHEAAIQQSFDEAAGAARRRDRERRAEPAQANVDLVVGALAELWRRSSRSVPPEVVQRTRALLLSEQVRKLSDALSSGRGGAPPVRPADAPRLRAQRGSLGGRRAADVDDGRRGEGRRGGAAAIVARRAVRAELRVEFNVAELREMMPDLAEEERRRRRSGRRLPW